MAPALQRLAESPGPAALLVLAGLVRGSPPVLRSHLPVLLRCLAGDQVCLTRDQAALAELTSATESVLEHIDTEAWAETGWSDAALVGLLAKQGEKVKTENGVEMEIKQGRDVEGKKTETEEEKGEDKSDKGTGPTTESASVEGQPSLLPTVSCLLRQCLAITSLSTSPQVAARARILQSRLCGSTASLCALYTAAAPALLASWLPASPAWTATHPDRACFEALLAGCGEAVGWFPRQVLDIFNNLCSETSEPQTRLQVCCCPIRIYYPRPKRDGALNLGFGGRDLNTLT